MILRILQWVIALALAGTIGVATVMRMIGHDPAEWHVDPATIERPGTPNDFLVAPEGATQARPDRIATMRNAAPDDLLFQFDAIARPAGAKPIAGSVKAGWITYVDRTLIMGYPDYITVKAITAGDGSALIIWSRSRFGQSDWGVNKERIEDWLAKMGG